MDERILKVLFVCSDNASRSLIAEAILRKDGGGRFNTLSGGMNPAASVNPFTSTVLAGEGYPADGLACKDWRDFIGDESPEFDFIFTLSDELEAQDFSQLRGKPVRAHWGISDPAAVEGSDIEKERAFVTALQQLRRRLSAFEALPFEGLNKMTLQARLGEIGRLD
jgi:arsenate reductase